MQHQQKLMAKGVVWGRLNEDGSILTLPKTFTDDYINFTVINSKNFLRYFHSKSNKFKQSNHCFQVKPLTLADEGSLIFEINYVYTEVIKPSADVFIIVGMPIEIQSFNKIVRLDTGKSVITLTGELPTKLNTPVKIIAERVDKKLIISSYDSTSTI